MGTVKSGVITRVEYRPKRPDRVNVYLDDTLALVVSSKVAEDAGLRRGLRLSEQDVASLVEDDRKQQAYARALSFISYRPRSEAEVRRSLLGKGFDEEDVDLALQRLRDARLVDDDAFARFWVENRDAFSPRGARALRAELRQRGVGDDIAKRASVEGRDEDAAALEAGSRKARQLRGLDARVFRQRLGGFLARRGFNYEQIDHAVKQLWAQYGAGSSSDDED